MNHTIRRIIGYREDYKKCAECNAINWYENTNCVYCSALFKREGSLSIEDVKLLLDAYSLKEIEEVTLEV
jgi:hypothetical protein